MSTAQRAILDRDDVGFDSYKEAWANYEVCLKRVGFAVEEPALNPTDSRRFLAMINPIPGEKGRDEDKYACSSRELNGVESAYLRDHPVVMDPVLRTEVFARLSQKRIPFTGTETKIGDFFPSGTEDMTRVNAILSIIEDSTWALFPDLPYVATGF